MSSALETAAGRPRAALGALARLRLTALEAPALCAVLSLIALAAGWFGTDLPAHVFRADMAARYGVPLWNDQWYGGHYLPAYGLLSPLLGATVGVRLTGVIACVAAAAFFSILVRRHFGTAGRAAALLFAVALVPDVIVGRVAFDVGLAAALASLAALQSGRRRLAVAAALVTPLGSPLAAAFLALAAVTVAVVNRSRAAALVAACAVAPAAVLVLAFPEGGSEPFGPTALLYAGLALAAFAWLVPHRERALRAGAIAYAVLCVASFAVPSPMGGNIVRLAMAVGAPLLLCAIWPRGRAFALVAAAGVLVWQWAPAVTAIGSSASDPARSAAYFAPVLRYLRTQPPARLEIPFTHSHWEAAYVAPSVPLARGWERQLDLRYNPLFYGGRPVTAAGYHAWLREKAVGYVALPDVPLDSSARREAGVLAARPGYLKLAYRSAHWTVWKVAGAVPLASGPATVVRVAPESVELRASAAGPVLLRVHYTPLWTVQAGAACVHPAPGGWTRVQVARPGLVRLGVTIAPLRLLGLEHGCSSG